MLKRTKLAITGAVAAGVVGAGAIAYAAFGYTPTVDAAGSAEKFEAVEVTAPSGTKALLPGEQDDVVLQIKNPNTGKVRAKVVKITPAGVDVLQSSTSANTPEAKAYCETKIGQRVDDAKNATPLPTLSAGTSKYTLYNGVYFAADMDIRCQGITFNTKWTVEIEAVR
jgi:hypothetical protein